MSGGMDIDWSARDRALRRAVELHGVKPRDELIELCDSFGARIWAADNEIDKLYRKRRSLADEQDYVLLLLRAEAWEIEEAKEALKNEQASREKTEGA